MSPFRTTYPLAFLSLITACASACGAPPRPATRPLVVAQPVRFTASGDTVVVPAHAITPPVHDAPGDGATVEQRVMASLDAQHGAVARCYADTLEQSPEAVGHVRVHAHIGPTGAIERMSARVEGEGGLAHVRLCVERAVRGAQLPSGLVNGSEIERVYRFENPAMELAFAEAFVVPRRTRGAMAVASNPESPPARAGALTEAEVRDGLTTKLAELQRCAESVPRSVRGPIEATARLTVRGNGVVEQSAVEAAPPGDVAGNCVNEVLRTVHLRASGTAVNLSVPFRLER